MFHQPSREILAALRQIGHALPTSTCHRYSQTVHPPMDDTTYLRGHIAVHKKFLGKKIPREAQGNLYGVESLDNQKGNPN